MAEWRADALERALTPDAVCAILPALLRALAGKPMIFTLRTEGGAARADYAALLLTAARCGAPWIDVEALRCPDAAGLIASLHAQGCLVIASHHDFDGTPALPALLDQARALRQSGADMIKLAVTARDQADIQTARALCERLREWGPPAGAGLGLRADLLPSGLSLRPWAGDGGGDAAAGLTADSPPSRIARRDRV